MSGNNNGKNKLGLLEEDITTARRVFDTLLKDPNFPSYLTAEIQQGLSAQEPYAKRRAEEAKNQESLHAKRKKTRRNFLIGTGAVLLSGVVGFGGAATVKHIEKNVEQEDKA